MKRFFCTLLAAVLLVTGLATVVFADDTVGTVQFSANTVTVNPGDTATLTVSLSGGTFSNYSLSSVTVSNANITISGSSITMNLASGKAAFATTADMNQHSFTISFNVPADTAAGTYPVTINVNNVRNSAGEVQSFTASATGNIIVEAPVCQHSWGEWTVTTAPTCTAKGVETRTCSLCSETETREIDMVAHTWGEWTVTTAATCTAKGVETRTCSVCSGTETREIDMVAHTWGEWTVTTAATCTTKGVETRTCSVCNGTETREIAATGHTWGDWTVTTAATCTAEGVETRTCSACGATETRAIPMIDHEQEWAYDDTDHWLVCSVCGITGEKEAHNHNIEGSDGYYYCECGHKGDKISPDVPPQDPDDPNLDDVPPTGDITDQVVMGGMTVLVAMFAFVAFLFKRKTAK